MDPVVQWNIATKRCYLCWQPVPSYRTECICHGQYYCDSHWDAAHLDVLGRGPTPV